MIYLSQEYKIKILNYFNKFFIKYYLWWINNYYKKIMHIINYNPNTKKK